MDTALANLPATAARDNTPPATIQLIRLFRQNCGPILLTYALLNMEHGLRLVNPLALGWAITGLLSQDALPLIGFLAVQALLSVVGSYRRRHDTRVFSQMHTKLAAETTAAQHRRGACLSQIAAHQALLREVVGFFERDLQFIFAVGYAVIGALLMLTWYDPLLGVVVGIALALALWANHRFSGRMSHWNRQLHDQLEREVRVLGGGSPAEVQEHFQSIHQLRVQISDEEAWNYGLLEMVNLVLIGVCLWRSCTILNQPGAIAAIFRYMMMLIGGLDTLPAVIVQLVKLHDIGKRLPAECTL